MVEEEVPWATGKERITTTYAWFLADWAKRMTWTEVARTFHTSWDTVYRSVAMLSSGDWPIEMLKTWRRLGLTRCCLISGHKYLTVVYQIDKRCRRLLWVGQERTKETLKQFFNGFSEKSTARLRFICSDIWQPYLDVIAEKAANAIHLLNRFHIVANMNKALDKVRAEEARQLVADG